MKSVSGAYKRSMAGLLRERSYARVYFGNIDAEAAEDGAWVSNGEMPWSSFDTVDYRYAYGPTAATLEWNRWTLDGTQEILSEGMADGFISDKLSDKNGAFPATCILSRQFDQVHMFPGVTITFDSRAEEWPVSVTVMFFLNDELVHTSSVGVTSAVLALETDVDEADRIEILFNTALPYRRPRVEYIIYGIGREYTNDEIVTLTQANDVDPLSRRLPDETFSFTILDYQHLYDPDNPEGIYRFVEINSPVSIKYGYTLPDGSIEWLKEDNYLLDAQPEVENNQATFTATGLIGSLTDIFYKSRLGRKSFYDMAEEVLLDADLTPTPTGNHPWVIDETLKGMYTTAVLPIDTHMNCLQLIAHACRCCLYTDDDNVIHIEPFGVTVAGIFSGEFSDNGHTGYSEWASVNSGTSVQETYATLEWNRWELGEDSQQVIVPDGEAKPTGYVSSHLSGADGTFTESFTDDSLNVNADGDLILTIGRAEQDFYLDENGHLIYTGDPAAILRIGDDGHLYEDGIASDEPIFTRTFDVKNDLPVVGLAFDGVLDEHPTAIEVRYFDGDTLLDTQTATVSNTNHVVLSDYALNCSRIEVTCKMTLPYYRFRVSKVYYKQTDFSLTFDNIHLGTQRISKIDKLKSVTVAKSVYTPNENVSKLYESTTDEESLHIEFQSIAENLTVELSSGAVESVTAYGRAVDLKVSPGMKTITISGNIISESMAVKTYDVSNSGETDAEENPLITDDDMRDALAEHVATYLQMRNTYDVEYRGNPELETRDIIGYQTAYTNEFYALILTDEITFDGSLHGAVKVKGLLNTGDYETIRIVAVVSPVGSGTVIGSGNYDVGDLVTLTARPGPDYRFAYWMEGGRNVGSSPVLEFIASGSRRLTAVFEALEHYTINLFVSPDGAGVTSGDGAYESGEEITVTATPASGYRFYGWLEDGVVVSTDSAYSFTVEKSRALTAMFRAVMYTVTLVATTGGTVSGEGEYRENSTVTVTATPTGGARFVRWTENGESVSESATYTFIVTGDRRLVALFKAAYTVTTTVEPVNCGYAQGGGTFDEGDEATVIATAYDGYDFKCWKRNDVIVSNDAEYRFTVYENTTMTAVFTEHVKTVVYYGEAQELSSMRYYLAAASIDDYAVFCGGYTGSGNSASVDAYSRYLTRIRADDLSKARRYLAAARVGGQALFGGGYTTSRTNALDVYTAGLTHIVSDTALYSSKYQLAATENGNYAVFAGGYQNTTSGAAMSNVDAFDAYLTRTRPTSLANASFRFTAASVGEYAVFAGGATGSGMTSGVTAYGATLERKTPTALRTARGYLAGASNGKYAIFAGGVDGGNGMTVVDAYDEDLTRNTPDILQAGRYRLAGTQLGNFAVFAGGYSTTSSISDAVDTYDETLTHNTPEAVPTPHANYAAAAVENFALFAGGTCDDNGNIPTDVVDVYTLT